MLTMLHSTKYIWFTAVHSYKMHSGPQRDDGTYRAIAGKATIALDHSNIKIIFL